MKVFRFSELYLAMLINREFIKLLIIIIRIQILQTSSIIKLFKLFKNEINF